MGNEESGFREVEHTADVEVGVWGEDRSSLFIAAAKGMYHLSQIRHEDGESEPFSRSFSVDERDLEGLLVAYLSELLFYLETEQIAFEEFELEFLDHQLKAQLAGRRIAGQGREIKGVTFHDLDIQVEDSGWKVNIVFDV